MQRRTKSGKVDSKRQVLCNGNVKNQQNYGPTTKKLETRQYRETAEEEKRPTQVLVLTILWKREIACAYRDGDREEA